MPSIAGAIPALMSRPIAAPATEEQQTLAPSNIDYNSPEGYGANKVAAENVLPGRVLPSPGDPYSQSFFDDAREDVWLDGRSDDTHP